jgi:hypothetical protein
MQQGLLDLIVVIFLVADVVDILTFALNSSEDCTFTSLVKEIHVSCYELLHYNTGTSVDRALQTRAYESALSCRLRMCFKLA